MGSKKSKNFCEAMGTLLTQEANELEIHQRSLLGAEQGSEAARRAEIKVATGTGYINGMEIVLKHAGYNWLVDNNKFVVLPGLGALQ